MRNLLKKLPSVDASGKVLSQRGTYIVVKDLEQITVRTMRERKSSSGAKPERWRLLTDCCS
jgi:hypothetical protein